MSEALAAASEVAEGADFIGCSTAGEFTEEGLSHGGIAVLLVATDDVTYGVAFAEGMKTGHDRVAEVLCQPFERLKREASESRRSRSTSILLTDGLSGTGEQAVEEIMGRTSGFHHVVGGAAGDEGKFTETLVGANGLARPDAAAALHLFSSKDWGIGVGHGLEPASERMRVTKSEGNVVFELDGKPAFEAYQAHAKRQGVELGKDNLGSYLIGNELGIYVFDQLQRARAPLSVGSDGSLACAGHIPKGASVCILDGEPDKMVVAAGAAAREARDGLRGNEPAGAIIFDCVCRGMILDGQFEREIRSVRSVLGDVPVAGFLTYGEIARYSGKLDGWHNTTAVILAIPA